MSAGPDRILSMPEGQVVEALEIADYLTTHRINRKWGQAEKATKQDNQIGVIAEFAVREAWGMEPWDRTTYPPFSERKNGDVGDLEVRGASYSASPLPLHPGTDDIPGKTLERNFLLVVVALDWRAMFVGWRPMRDAVELWRKHRVEQSYKVMREWYWCLDQKHLWSPDKLVIVEDGKEYWMLTGDVRYDKAGERQRVLW